MGSAAELQDLCLMSVETMCMYSALQLHDAVMMPGRLTDAEAGFTTLSQCVASRSTYCRTIPIFGPEYCIIIIDTVGLQ